MSTAWTAAGCTAIAAVLAVLVPAMGGFRIAWVNSLCIGLTANLFINSGRHLFWPRREPAVIGLILVCLASVLISIWIGAHLAAAMLGESAEWLTQDDGSGIRIAALLATVGGTATIAGVVWVRQYTAALKLRTQLEQARADAASRLADEARLRMLQAQLEPHMLFNTLATLRALIGIDPQRAQVMLDDLVTFLRATLNASRSDQIRLDHEFALIDSYLKLMSLRMGARLTYRLTLPAALEPVTIPPMLIQPLVENAIRHGLELAPGGGHISVSAARIDQWLEIAVTDDGAGFAGAEPGVHPEVRHAGAHSGFGLDAVRARLRSGYADQAGFDICSPYPHDAAGGARITLRLPLRTAPIASTS